MKKIEQLIPWEDEQGYTYMSGYCSVLAVALHEITDLPIYGLYNNEDTIHFFVKDGEFAYDARGRVDIKDIDCYELDGISSIKKEDPTDISFDVHFNYTDDFLEETLDYARKLLAIIN